MTVPELSILSIPQEAHLKPQILLEQVISLARKKAKADEVVDRGSVSLKVIRDNSGRSFRFIGHSILTGRVFLNATPIPIRPRDKIGEEKVLLLYLVDYSTHQDFRRIFYFTFSDAEEKRKFAETMKPLYNEIIGGGDETSDVYFDDSDDSDGCNDDTNDKNDNDDDKDDDKDDEEENDDEDPKNDDDDAHEDEDDQHETQLWPDGYIKVLTKWH